MQPALDIFFPEPRFLEDLGVGKKIDAGTGPPCLPHFGEQAVLQLGHGISPLVAVLIENTADAYVDGHS